MGGGDCGAGGEGSVGGGGAGKNQDAIEDHRPRGRERDAEEGECVGGMDVFSRMLTLATGGGEGVGGEGEADGALVGAAVMCVAVEMAGESGGSSCSSSPLPECGRGGLSRSPSWPAGKADDGGKVCAPPSAAGGVGGVERQPGRDSRFSTDDAAVDDDELGTDREAEEEDAAPPAGAVTAWSAASVNRPLPNEMTTSSRGAEEEEEADSAGAGGRRVGEASVGVEEEGWGAAGLLLSWMGAERRRVERRVEEVKGEADGRWKPGQRTMPWSLRICRLNVIASRAS